MPLKQKPEAVSDWIPGHLSTRHEETGEKRGLYCCTLQDSQQAPHTMSSLHAPQATPLIFNKASKGRPHNTCTWQARTKCAAEGASKRQPHNMTRNEATKGTKLWLVSCEEIRTATPDGHHGDNV